MLLVKNAALADFRREIRADILINGGKIEKIAKAIPETGVEKVINADGYTLMPAFVDLHAHFRDPGLTHKETVETGCMAAVRGGYVFANLMPNTKPVCSDMETVRYVQDKADKLGLCAVNQTVSITKSFDGASLEHINGLDETVKWLSDDGFGVDSTKTMLEAMRMAKEKGIGLMLHEEDSALSKTDMYLAEELQTFRDVELAVLTGCKTHFCHVSTINAMDYIISGKKRCENITCEVTPHHIALNDSVKDNVNPPLRGEAHRKYLIECIKNGWVDAIATDHAPHTAEEKANGINGFTGLDFSFAVCYTALVKAGHIALSELSRLMSYNPARLMGLDLGAIEEGHTVSVVLADLREPFTASEKDMRSKSKNSPFLGMELYGRVVMTIKEGEIVYEEKID